MKKWIGNSLVKLILNADKSLRSELYNSLKNNNASIRANNYRKKYQISSTFKFNGKNIKFYGDGEIVCGSNSYIGDYSTIQAARNYKVVIGDNCSISHNVRIYTSSNDSNQNMNNEEPKLKTYGNVTIGNGVWIGANVFINQGIAIGDNVIIGANSVVTQDLVSNGIYGGVPARLIRHKDDGVL